METFSAFGETSLAVATIAQVHEATLADGRHVAVKVQRPGLKAVIATDAASLNYLVALGQGIFPRKRALVLPVLVSEMANSLNRETDCGREARSMMLIRAALADVPAVRIPEVVAECSGMTVLTMENSVGQRVDLYAKPHPDEMPHVIDTLVKLTLHVIFEEGLFHADPHPGNVFVLPDARLSLLDCGNTGDLDEPMRESLTHLLEAVVTGDARGATDAYLEMAPANEKVDRAALLVDIKSVLYEIRRSDLGEVSVGTALEALLHSGSRNGMRNPAEFVQLSRAFVIMQSFKEEIARLTAQHFSAVRIKDKTTEVRARDGTPDARGTGRHTTHPSPFCGRRPRPASRSGGAGASHQPQSRPAHGLHGVGGPRHRRLDAADGQPGRMGSSPRRGNARVRSIRHCHRPCACSAPRT